MKPLNVYQTWDPLKVMMVGRTYPPEMYDYIKNEKVRKVFYKIAEETEEDYLKLIALLEKLNVKVLRTDIESTVDTFYNLLNNFNKGHDNIRLPKPGSVMQPRDHTIMLGENFYFIELGYVKTAVDFLKLHNNNVKNSMDLNTGFSHNNMPLYMNAAMTSRIGKDLIVGSIDNEPVPDLINWQNNLQRVLKDYRIHLVDTGGHTDGTFCPVVPGLIISIYGNEKVYEKLFPGWEVIHLPEEGWYKVGDWVKLKHRNAGKWWVPGEELNIDFTDYVEQWMGHWVGYVEESVFDVNMIVVDRNNVIVNGYNKKVFDAFSKHGITPHVCNFRHRYFWDGGLHCITTDLHREGVMTDWFPNRNL